MEHLTKNAASCLQLTDKERIAYINKPKWLGYPYATKVLNKLSDLLEHPKCHRMPNLMIIGDTNNGKTMIAKKFLKLNPPDDNPQGDAAKVPVVYIQAPAVPDENRFYNAILEKLYAPFKPSDRVDRKLYQVKTILNRVDTKILMIDEIHHILAGNYNKQKVFLNVIKHLSNDLEIPIVGIGIDTAQNALRAEPQLSNRFERVNLPIWKSDKDYYRFLMSYERILPLKKGSKIYNVKIAEKLLTLGENLIGEITSLINKAAIEAIRNKSERITLNTLKQIDWSLPSSRE
jgi:hypothetical protein